MTPADLETLRDQLKYDEGLRLLPYVDTVGKISIGYGRNLSDVGITFEEATTMLDQDIARHQHDLIKAFPVVLTLDSVRQIVLCNMAFNLGVPRLAQFTRMWAAIQRRDFVTAASEMLNSRWAGQVGARATRLAASMSSGEIK